MVSREGEAGSALQVLEQYIAGDVAEANALPQLEHFYRKDPRLVLAALSEKANSVVANADAGSAASHTGALIVNVARYMDERPAGENGKPAAGAIKSLSRALLDHVLLLTGGKNRAAKETSVRSQGCALVAALMASAPDHPTARDKLVEFSSDKYPAIRETAIRGLAFVAAGSPTVEQVIIARSGDPFTAVRTSAVRSARVTTGTVPALMKRLDDIEACVRAQVYHTLAKQPEALEEFGPAALARLMVGLLDRSSSVRSAAGLAVDVFHKSAGGSALKLLSRCDVLSDEALGDAAAGALAARFQVEGAELARRLLSGGKCAKGEQGLDGLHAALMLRQSLAVMSDEDRDELVDVPLLLQRANEALGAAQGRQNGGYILRQLLHIVTSVDFCDEASRRRAERLAEAVLMRAPLEQISRGGAGSGGVGIGSLGGGGASGPVYNSADLGVLILRKCAGLGRGFHPRTGKFQSLEAQCSTRAVLLVSDLCQPLQGGGGGGGGEDDEEDGEGHFATRLSFRLQELNEGIEERKQQRSALVEQKKKAIAKEDFIQAQKVKEAAKKNDAELAALTKEQGALRGERDSILLRVLAILTALLKWSNSDLQKDPAQFGTLDQILRPIVSLPALSDEVEVATITAICLFCSRDGESARGHWCLLLELLRSLRQDDDPSQTATKRRHSRSRAAVAARTLVDCAVVHGNRGALDREEMISAAHALAAVPFPSRQIVIEPLCSWFLGLGHVFFEEHLREPVLEVQWALGWMLVEAFKQHGFEDDEDGEEAASASKQAVPREHAAATAKAARGRGVSWVTRPPADGAAASAGSTTAVAKKEAEQDEGSFDDDEDSVQAMVLASRLMQFFNLLPRLPGKHAAPMLSLAVESIAESGLWRRAVLLPQVVGGKARWLRGFSWPQLFCFAHERLPAEMRFRLWRCALQVCVADPDLAPFAEVPFALANVVKEAPPGAADLLREAVALGADAAALHPLLARIPPAQREAPPPEGAIHLSARAEAQAAEAERRASLSEQGIDINAWAPAEVHAPEMLPPHHRMKMQKAGAAPKKRGAENAAPIVPPSAWSAVAEQPTPQQQNKDGKPDGKRRRCIGKTKDAEGQRVPLRDIR